MNTLRNESGVALVVTLIVLVVFSILGLSLGAMTVSNNQLRIIANNQIEGKLLAEIGLEYFKESLEKKLNDSINGLQDAMRKPEENDAIMAIANTTANNSNPIYLLNDEKNGGFSIHFEDKPLNKADESGRIAYKDGTTGPSQPYIRRLDVTVTGVPAGSDRNQKQVSIQSTFYINTIPEPFHYALSTPGELRLFGGSNIIGHVSANKLVVSSSFRYKDDSGWHVLDTGQNLEMQTGFTNNKPYVEGKIFLKDQIIPITQLNGEEPNALPFPSINRLDFTRETLSKYFLPKQLNENSNIVYLSAEKPYLPGYEVPDVIKEKSTPFQYSLQSYLEDIFETIKQESGYIKVENHTEDNQAILAKPLSIDPDSFHADDFDFDSIPNKIAQSPSNPIMIRSYQEKTEPVAITARLSGTQFTENHINELYIFPDNDRTSVKVEMGSSDAFPDAIHPLSTPFSYTGTMFIRGDLDILGNIDVNGTIFVDGNVVITDVTNEKQDGNLVIISTGTITLTHRNISELTTNHTFEQWEEIKPLRAFLYSGQSIQIYSAQSTNKIIGGIAAGNEVNNTSNNTPYLEINTLREHTNLPDEPDLSIPYFASRFSARFNRNIFEKETPGLPVIKNNEKFYIDIYDVTYN